MPAPAVLEPVSPAASGSAGPAALTGGFQWAFWVCGAIGLAAIPITFLLVRSRDLVSATAAQAALSTDSLEREAA